MGSVLSQKLTKIRSKTINSSSFCIQIYLGSSASSSKKTYLSVLSEESIWGRRRREEPCSNLSTQNSLENFTDSLLLRQEAARSAVAAVKEVQSTKLFLLLKQQGTAL